VKQYELGIAAPRRGVNVVIHTCRDVLLTPIALLSRVWPLSRLLTCPYRGANARTRSCRLARCTSPTLPSVGFLAEANSSFRSAFF
jgi:hypothetical protein